MTYVTAVIDLSIPASFILNDDGVLMTGRFFVSNKGKINKAFGPCDSNAIKLMQNSLSISILIADECGLQISEKCVAHDMGYFLELIKKGIT